MDDYMFFAMADGQFKQKFIKNYSIPAVRVSVMPNFTPSSAGGFSLSQSAAGKASTGDEIKRN